MARNTFGNLLKITSFGESHGAGVGAVIDGFPAGFAVDLDHLQAAMDRRKPGQSKFTTKRQESDRVQILSGIFEGKSTGAPIALFIPNEDAVAADYSSLKEVYRPSHADFTYEKKYGIRDYRGGGRSSARVTAGWVAAGALAEQYLSAHTKMEIVSWVDSVYQIRANVNAGIITRSEVETSAIRCPDDAASARIETEIEMARTSGDSLGGTIRGVVRNCPVGLGEPVFGKLHALLGQAFLSINAVKGVEFGDGFAITTKKGSEVNDAFEAENGIIQARTNHSGGIQGGISNGENLDFKIAFKPTATIAKTQQTVNQAGENITLEASGRHDPCVLPRAVPIVEAMTALVLMDLFIESLARG